MKRNKNLDILQDEVRRVQDDDLRGTLIGIIETGVTDQDIKWLKANADNKDVVGEVSQEKVMEWVTFLWDNR